MLQREFLIIVPSLNSQIKIVFLMIYVLICLTIILTNFFPTFLTFLMFFCNAYK